jgi:hypothetical protein
MYSAAIAWPYLCPPQNPVLVSAMTQTNPPHTTTLPTAARARVFIFVRARNVVLLGSLALLALAGPATAQLPSLPAMPGLPPVDQNLATPAGSLTLHAADSAVDACLQGQASTTQVPIPSVPTLPLPLPAPMPQLPEAAAAARLCAHANLDDLSASTDANANADSPAGPAGLDTQAHASPDGIDAHATPHAGLIDTLIGWIKGWF